MKRETVLVVDDEVCVLAAANDALAERFYVLTADNAQSGVRLAIECQPDIILLDTEMPGMSGYQACEILKCEPITHHAPIVFISAGNRVRDRMLGYELGAEEFIPKPFDADELRHRLERLSKRMLQHQDLSARADMATKTAMTVMAGNSELGMAIQFVDASYAISTLEELAQRLLRTCEVFGLSCVVLLVTNNGPRFFASRGEIKPVEEDLMLALHGQPQRFHDFGCRTQLNFTRTALLVKNMPLDDRDRYGRLKDLFPVLLGALDARMRNIETEQALLSQTQNLIRSFKIVESTLQSQSNSLQANHELVAKVVHSLWKDIEAKLSTLGLDEDQEQFLMTHIEKALDETHDVMESVENLQASFASVMRLFSFLTEKQQKMVDDFMKKPAIDTVAVDYSASNEPASDIELF